MSEPTITREAVLAIHSEAIARFGGIDGVRDEFLSTMPGVADGTVNYDELVEWVRGVVQ